MTDDHPFPSMRYLKCVAPCEICGELIVLCEKYQGRSLTAVHADCIEKREAKTDDPVPVEKVAQPRLWLSRFLGILKR